MRTSIKIPLLISLFSVVFYSTYQISKPSQPTIVIVGDDDFRADIKYALKIIQESKSTGDMIQSLQKTGRTVYISQGPVSLCGIPKDRLIRIKAGLGMGVDSHILLGDDFDAPIYLVLAHELQHALDFAQGTFNWDTTHVEPGVSGVEFNAMKRENKMEAEFGLPIRLRHDQGI